MMKPSKGYYSLIQYCPDHGRLEAANVGVLLFCPERGFLKALTAKDNARIIHFFGSEGHDWSRLNSYKTGLEDRLKNEHNPIRSLDDLERFIALRANLLQITPPRPMKVFDPEQHLELLFRELVGGRLRRKSVKGLRSYLEDQFAGAGLESKIRRDIRLKVPVVEKEVEFPFGYQNGRFNLIRPVRFTASTPEKAIDTAYKHAVEGNELYEHPDPEFGELKLIVFGRFRAEDHESPNRVNTLLDGYRVKLVRSDELPALIEEIRQTGKDLHAMS